MEALDRALSSLEAALEATAEMLPSTETMVELSQPYLTNEELPEGLRDPMAVLERGRQVEARGLQLSQPQVAPLQIRDEFAMAARNGGTLTDEVVKRMHADRSASVRKRM